MVFLSSRISPRTSTVILRDRSPLATAVVTSAMLRTWAVRLPAIELTRVRQILPNARHALHFRLPAELAFGAHFARHARHFRCERAELIHHRVDGVLQLQDFALHIHRDLAAKGRRWPPPWSLPRCCGPARSGCPPSSSRESVRSFHTPPTPFTTAWPPSLPSVPTSRATRVTSRGEGVQLLHHGVHHARGVQELALERAAVHFQRHGLREVALGHRADHARHFRGGLHQVADQAVDRIQALRPVARTPIPGWRAG